MGCGRKINSNKDNTSKGPKAEETTAYVRTWKKELGNQSIKETMWNDMELDMKGEREKKSNT